MKGFISDIKRMSVHDGPGIRTTLFLKGCPLRCRWCHNPENLHMARSLSYTEKLCVGCGACAEVCKRGVHSFRGQKHELSFADCIACGACVRECYTGALKLYGEEIEPEAAAERLLEDRAFFESSGGGVTFSGGEPLLQAGFLAEVIKLLKVYGVHIAVDTCGEVPWDSFSRILSDTDLFLFDVKHIDTEAHKAATGVGNERILDNLRRLADSGAGIEIRTPVIPGYNDDMDVLRRIAVLLKSLGGIRAWRLLPYHSMGKAKYEAMGLSYEMPELEMPDIRRMRSLQEALRDVFPDVLLSSDLPAAQR